MVKTIDEEKKVKLRHLINTHPQGVTMVEAREYTSLAYDSIKGLCEELGFTITKEEQLLPRTISVIKKEEN